ncbi:MAG: LysM peptidoglycan-binding domain-containing protein [Acidobacteria bacterium]|nr:LysM peptidoglycan-binding domain-containing protein [Acidobacteriota bacterium]
MIARVEAAYNQGMKEYRSGNLQAAKQHFDRALSLLLESKMDIQDNNRLDAEFEKVVENTYGLEVDTMENGDTLSQNEYEPAPIDSFSGLTFPVDPKVRARIQRELLSVRSDLPLVSNDYVAGFITYFQNHEQGFIERVLQRVGIYQPMISAVLRQNGLPQDLIYLAAAESAFNPLAVSRAGARGMWQFMASRAREYGLQINRWVDEREDPLESTEAAAHHLKDLYHEFGDWYLAMAAYNCGPLNVQKAVEDTGYANFWKLRELHALPTETENYVPIIIATALIAKDPRAYGFDVRPDPPLREDHVVVTAPTDLRLVAELIDRPVKELVSLNPSLLSWATPMNEAKYVLNLPVGTKQEFEKRIAEVPPSERIWWRAYRVKGGETLMAIARKYRIRETTLASVNHLESGDDPEAGTYLILPLPPGREALYREGHFYSYRIRRGDTLGAIAARFHVDLSQLRRWNHLRGSQIIAGRILRLYGGKERTAWADGGGSRAKWNGHVYEYRVRQGDTLGLIATHFHVTVADLRLWNHLRSSTILVGQTLRLNSPSRTRRVAYKSERRTESASAYHYRIQRGDTLGLIADRFNVTVAQIRRWNHLDGSIIIPGETLTLYRVSED